MTKRLHENDFRLVYGNVAFDFEELLKTINSFAIYHKNLNTIIKSLQKRAPKTVTEFFHLSQTFTWNMEH